MILHTQLVFNKYFRRVAYSAVVSYVILTLVMFFPIDFRDSRATEVPVEAETTLDITSTRVDVLAMLDEEDKTGQFFSASTDVAIATNNYTGYTARLSAMQDEDYDKMYAEDGENYLASIEENTSEEAFNEDMDLNGKFGFKPSKLNSEENDDYVPAPNTEGIVIEKTNGANDEANEYSVAVGVRLDRSALVGIYSNSYAVTATVNPVPYQISYGDGVDDEVIVVPEPQGDMTTTPIVTLSDFIPERDQYIFRGWCDGDVETENKVDVCDGCAYQPGDSFPLNKTTDNDIEIIALWEREYEVSFDLNTGTGQTPASVKVVRDDNMPRITVAAPTKTGYTLNGWYDSRSGGTKYYNADGTSAKKWDKTEDGVVMYAQWTPNNYYIVYAGNNNTSGVMANTTCTYDQECTLRTNNFARNGYTFGGWTYNGVTYSNGQKITNLATDGTITFTAKWDIVSYSITYTGSNASNPTSYTVETNTITLNNPSKTGYNFTGWTGSNGNTPQTTVKITKGSTGNRAYNANYSAINYSISYTLNGGSASNPGSYNIETNTITLNNPTRNGYTFTGWTGSNGNTPQTTVKITKGSTGNKSYTANWTPVSYGITYNLGGGTVSPANPTSYTIETATFTLRNPSKSYYNFTGWTGSNGNSPQTSVSITKGNTGAKTYNANYSPVNYSISYNYDGGTASNPGSYNIETNTFTLNNPTKPGFTFTGWSGTGLSGSSNMTVTIAKGSHDARSYTAHWQQDCTFTSKDFGFTGGTQAWTVPGGCSGTYLLEVWGAQGGGRVYNTGAATGGKGGYAKGTVNLTAGSTIYVVVGGQGSSMTSCTNSNSSASTAAGGYNGGGYIMCDYYNGNAGSGGGATHIGTFNSTLAAHGNTSGLYIVAGGGGGGGPNAADNGSSIPYGGIGGGTSGGNGTGLERDRNNGVYGYGGSQTAGGRQPNRANGDPMEDLASFNYGSFGQGGSQKVVPHSQAVDWGADTTGSYNSGAGGGGGLYGGGAGLSYSGSSPSGGGGSGYTGGVSGGSMTSGAREGNGYARITKQ